MLAFLCIVAAVLPTQSPVSSSFQPAVGTPISWYNSTIGFIVDSTSLVYQTNDGGLSWRKQTLININIASIVASTVEPRFVFFVGEQSQSSQQRGYVFQNNALESLTLPLAFDNVLVSTVASNTLVAAGATNTLGSLYASTDAGRSWQLCSANLHATHLVSWGNAGAPDVPKTRIFFISEDASSGSTSLQRTDDFGRTLVTLVPNAFKFAFTPNYVAASVCNSSSGDVSYVDVSYIRQLSSIPTDANAFVTTMWPLIGGVSSSHSYLAGEAGLWVGIVNTRSGGHYGDLYSSDNSGYQFVLTLPHISAWSSSDSIDPVFDFQLVPDSFGAVIIANNVTNWAQVSSGPKTLDRLQTLMSSDAGGTWHYLTSPALTWDGSPGCAPASDPRCRLHFHGPTTLSTLLTKQIRAESLAPGLVIGSGNVGEFLSYTERHTYLSINWGLTWIELPIPPGAHVPVVLAYASLIAFVPEIGDTIYYSTDYGTTVNSFVFADSSIVLEGIDTNGLRITISGYVQSSSTPFLTQLDFTQVIGLVCDSSQLETFTPSTCTLGQMITFSRKAASATCLMLGDAANVEVSSCVCTRDDFECDFGFEPSGSKCVLSGIPIDTNAPKFCPAGSTYTVTQGYRRVPGDKCSGGVESSYAPKTKPCPTSSSTSHALLVGFLSAGITLLLLCVFTVFALRSERMRNRLPSGLVSALPAWLTGPSSAPGALIDEEDYEDNDNTVGVLIDKHSEDEPEELADNVISERVAQQRSAQRPAQRPAQRAQQAAEPALVSFDDVEHVSEQPVPVLKPPQDFNPRAEPDDFNPRA